MNGRKIIKKYDKGGWALYKTRNWGERDYKSDRQKGIRKALNQQIRQRLKRDTDLLCGRRDRRCHRTACGQR